MHLAGLEPRDVEPLEPRDSGAGVESLTFRFVGMELALRQLTDVTNKSYTLLDRFLESVLAAAKMELLEELHAADGNGGFPGLDVAAVRNCKQVTSLTHSLNRQNTLQISSMSLVLILGGGLVVPQSQSVQNPQILNELYAYFYSIQVNSFRFHSFWPQCMMRMDTVLARL